MRIIFLATLVSILLVSCEGLDFKGFIAHSSIDINSRFRESINYNKTIEFPSRFSNFLDGPIQRFEVKDDKYVLYYGTDIHIADSTDNLKLLVNMTNYDPQAIAMLLGGDMIQKQEGWDRLDKTIEEIEQKENPVNKPIFATIGNHDLFYGQWTRYRDIFHTSTWYIEIDRKNEGITECDVLVSLDSGDGVIGECQQEWLTNLLGAIRNYNNDSVTYKSIIVMTHTNIFNTCDVSNFPLTETYSILGLMSRMSVNTVIMGHDHHREINYFGGVKYVMTEALKQENHGSIEPGILKVTVNGSDIVTDFYVVSSLMEQQNIGAS